MQNLTIALMMLVCFALYLQSVDLRAVKRKQDLAACESDSECPEGYACNLDMKRCDQDFKRRDNSEGEDSESDSSDSSGAKDIDECATNNGNCEQICSNTVGSYECSCMSGYALNVDGSSCDDIDECATNNGNCGQLCNNTVGSYECSCMAGYALNVDGSSCDDVDECLLETDCCNGTSHNCSNTDGSYECSCDEESWTLATDGCECIREPCPAEWTLFNSSCYRKFGDFYTDWFTAKDYCSNNGGYLLRIGSAEENSFVATFTNYDQYFWFHAVDLIEEGNYTYDSGELLQYLPTTIRLNSEESDCAYLFYGDWIMQPCSTHVSFVCEQPSNE